MGEIAGPALTGPDEVSGERSRKETFSPRWPKQPSGAWPFEHDFDPAVLRPALRRVVRRDRVRRAKPLGRQDIGVDPPATGEMRPPLRRGATTDRGYLQCRRVATPAR